jgi:hypothetical protein
MGMGYSLVGKPRPLMENLWDKGCGSWPCNLFFGPLWLSYYRVLVLGRLRKVCEELVTVLASPASAIGLWRTRE